MKYLLGKLTLIAILILLVSCKDNKTLPEPHESWDDYKLKECCPKQFIEVSYYCVNCTAPNHFDPIDQRCRPCPYDKIYNKTTKLCDCKIQCDPPRVLTINNTCQCPPDNKGGRKVWNKQDKTCNCPAKFPLWNGKYCVRCPNGTQFDPRDHQCYKCAQGFKRDYSTHACIPGV